MPEAAQQDPATAGIWANIQQHPCLQISTSEEGDKYQLENNDNILILFLVNL